ncbi:MAG: family 43 glycosylhydrolase [Bacteroidales bacterium]|nr:family 43 glycosylhydrolase [Bacteroidales bacterium]
MMKKLLLLPLLLATLFAAAQQRFTNPVLHQDFSDPDVCRVGEDYYMTASSFNCFPGLPILHSRDLVHWEQIGAALTDYPGPGWNAPEDDFHGTVQHGNGVWAPAIRYHEGWFYIFCGDPDRGVFMVRTQDPAGTWEAPVWVVKAKGFIDPCPLWDEDGRAWLSHALAGSRAGLKSVLLAAPMAPDGTSLTGPSRIVYDGHRTQPTIEGTKLYKKDGKYYLFAPAGGVSTGWQTVLRANDIFGPWEERVVMAWAPGTVNGPHQGAWVDTPSGESWFLHFQDKGAYGRIVHLQPMTWQEDGWPVIGEDPDGDGVGQPVTAWECPVSNGMPAPASRLNAYGLGREWQYPAVPSPTWHATLPDGSVRLYSVPRNATETNLWNCLNLLLQKFPGESFTVSARLRFHPNAQLPGKGEEAGFIVMGNDYAVLRLTDTKAGACLQFAECKDAGKNGKETITDLTVLPYRKEPHVLPYASGNVPPVSYPDWQEALLWVKLEVHPRTVEGNVPEAVCRFSYSTDGKKYRPAGGEFSASPETWIGAKFGFYCNRPAPRNDAGWVDVEELQVR